MALAIAQTRASLGIEAPLVRVEVHLGGGLPALSVVGLAETAVKEARERVRSAIENSGFEFPRRRITVNLSPADLPKDGGRFDLPIALGILAASEQLPGDSLESYECAGELGLAGDLRAIPGVLPLAMRAHAAARYLLLPSANAAEAGLVAPQGAFAAATLIEACAHLRGTSCLPPVASASAPEPSSGDMPVPLPDLADVRGQLQARRCLEIAAAGGHSLLLSGPPGTGKSLLAARVPGILPPMSDAEARETAAIHSVGEVGFDAATWRRRPFRSPHHSASHVALIGGGSRPRPGEVSLAHRGVLFLDELPEFARNALEVLREPLETGEVVISRASAKVRYPAAFQLVAAMNPCPCGYSGDPGTACRCTPDQIVRYRGRLSGPLLDRIDMFVEVPRLTAGELRQLTPGEASSVVRERVEAAAAQQRERDGDLASRLTPAQLDSACSLSADAAKLLEDALERLGLSARAYHRCLRIARTIADLAGSERLNTNHVAEAIGYRRLHGG